MSRDNDPVPDVPSDLEISTIRKNDEGDFTITLPRSKFAEFLLGFLGPKETLSKNYPHDFLVKLDDIFQFHNLLVQKTMKEQFISLSLATSTLQYEDGTQRTINTIESLEKFHEYRDLGVVSFNIVWQFLFRMPEQTSIQQQKVSLFFNTQIVNTTGVITISIEHTNQVWAVEVLRMFEEQIKKISIQYSLPYRTLSKLRKLNVFGFLMALSLVIIFSGIFYIAVQRNNLMTPSHVEAEFMFDLADVLSPKSIDIHRSSAKTQFDQTLLLQFFLIRDLRNADYGVIKYLMRRGYFDQRYSDLVEKLISGYYDKNIESKKIFKTLKSELDQLRIIQSIAIVIDCIKIFLVYIFSYLISGLYLHLFRMRSVIAITSKGDKILQKQERDKSNVAQVFFGVVASLIAALLYDLLIRGIL